MRSSSILLPVDQLKKLAQEPLSESAQVALVFASRESLEDDLVIQAIKEHIACPCVFTSTAGQISNLSVEDLAISFTFIELEKSELNTCNLNIADFPNGQVLGQALFDSLYREDLAGIMVFADGISLNGSELKEGLEANNHARAPITGGLAGDGARFDKTLVGIDSVSTGNVCAIAFYGEHISIGHGSRGGWVDGSELNMVSRSVGNVLHEIEGIPALDFYKRKLNGSLKSMPADALKHPFSISSPTSSQDLVRTVLSVDEESKTMTFAGDIPVFSNVKILSATKKDLIQGAKAAAHVTLIDGDTPSSDLAILISCVGRKLVLEERTIDEVIAVQNVLKAKTICGFYSYGELSPSDVSGRCELHNQTMTITTLREK